ncbi:hypothetical protein [Chitinolyticbacter meiyuanensis]|uniref:hypothetical protein n=1 Tax=Chitinolyticbacter meiyuanensis TaxID=682798 RepID=UPI0011E5F226|nr:hypothetical protein [Chitinolyticbacter meiyuanensis]
MNLYEVIRWGNDGCDPYRGGPNGDDTCLLVRAATPEQAATLADPVLARLGNVHVAGWAQAIYQLGIDTGSDREARVLRGPYLQHAYRHGWPSWQRDQPEGAWQALPD